MSAGPATYLRDIRDSISCRREDVSSEYLFLRKTYIDDSTATARAKTRHRQARTVDKFPPLHKRYVRNGCHQIRAFTDACPGCPEFMPAENRHKNQNNQDAVGIVGRILSIFGAHEQ